MAGSARYVDLVIGLWLALRDWCPTQVGRVSLVPRVVARLANHHYLDSSRAITV